MEVHRFLVLAGYYHRFTECFTKIASSLHALTGDRVRFAWDEHCEEDFETLKDRLRTAPVLTTFNPKLPASLDTDTSQLGLGAVIYQGEKHDKHVLTYASRCVVQNE